MRQHFFSLFRTIFARKIWQPLWERLHKLSLLGMNISAEPDIFSSGELYALQIYRHLLADVPNPILFDAGANSGEYAIEYCKIFPKGAVFCFEPSAATFALLQKNISSYQQIVPINLGLGDTEQSATLFADTEGSGLASLLPSPDFHAIHLSQSETISLTTINTFCKLHNIQHIHLLKLDIEGYELKALTGAKELLSAGSIDIIQFEFGYANINAGTYFRTFYELLSPNYAIFRILKNGLRHIPRYSEVTEQFLLTNFCAIRKPLATKII